MKNSTRNQPDKIPQCARCGIREKICEKENGHGPDFCPTIHYDAFIKQALQEYENPEIRKFAYYAAVQEGECYANRGKKHPYIRLPVKTRIQETIEFANKLGFKRLGIAFCGGLKNEARILSEILESQGFEVASVICMVGRTPKEFLGLSEDQKVNIGAFESMCNPIVQAKILNAVDTELNIVFGLCVGHDALFMRFSKALCTVLVVKDRVTGHNPLAALSLYRSYYQKFTKEKFGKGGAVTVTTEKED